MDRLLTQEEQYEAEHEWLFEWSDIPQEYKRDLLKAQDAKTAHLVATQIFKELEERCPHIPDVFDWKKRQCLICFEEIKEKHGVKE